METSFIKTLSVPPFELAVCLMGEDLDTATILSSLNPVLEAMAMLCPAFLDRILAEGIPQALSLPVEGTLWEVSINVVSNNTIRQLNMTYRQKDEATDVLSFGLLADSPARETLVTLPVVDLGSIIISWDWAQEHCKGQLTRFVLERWLHGMLHLLGVHHDTMADYRRVVAIQTDVLAKLPDVCPVENGE